MPRKKKKVQDQVSATFHLEVVGENLESCNQVCLKKGQDILGTFYKNTSTRVPYVFTSTAGESLRLEFKDSKGESATLIYRYYNDGLGKGEISVQYVVEDSAL